MAARETDTLMSARFILTIVASCLLLAFDTVTPLPLAIWFLQVVLLWVTTLWANRVQIRVAGLMTAAFILLSFRLTPAVPGMAIHVSNLLFALAAVFAITQTSLHRKASDEERLSAARELAASQAELRVLKGYLPICSSCKSIRNEAGDWEALENYISNHSEAQFSHGLCSPCIKKLYPNLSSALDKKSSSI